MAQEDFAYYAKFCMVCEILWLLIVVSHGVRNFFHSVLLSILQLLLLLISHSHAKMLVVGFLPLGFFLAFLIGLATYCQAWQKAMKCSKARILHVFELQLALPWITQNSPSFLACFNDKKATKNIKTFQKLISNPN